MKKYFNFISIYFIGCFYCNSQSGLSAEKVKSADIEATSSTKTLLNLLTNTSEFGFLFGHQDDLAYGVNWKYIKGRSDVKESAGDYPAIYGWDVAGLDKGLDKNIDGVPFDKMKAYIIETSNRGGITTISWHLDNPLTYKNAWDTTPNTLKSILKGGNKHNEYKNSLDKLVSFFLSLKDKKNQLVPVIFRPYHEQTGTWFWWGKNNEAKDYIELWRFTEDYLKEKGVHNLIYAYSTADFTSEKEFLEFYPGDEYVDILGFDKYELSDPTKDNTFIENCQKQFAIMNKIAINHKKLIAFTETGYEQIPYSKWWTETLLKAIGEYKIAYVLVWRNHGLNTSVNTPHMHYYAPYKGQITVPDFRNFYNLPQTIFEKDFRKIQSKNNVKPSK